MTDRYDGEWTDEQLLNFAKAGGYNMGDVWLPMLRGFANALQAARATAEPSAFALQMLVAAGHVSQAKVDEALSIAAATPGIRAADRDSVIEECAVICEEAEDNFKTMDRKQTARMCAAKIRALRSQQDAAIEAGEKI